MYTYSSCHVYCPRCEKIMARYVEKERTDRLELDRIDKVLFILPFLTLADTVSTINQQMEVFSKRFRDPFQKVTFSA